jgi:hypothetical protein
MYERKMVMKAAHVTVEVPTQGMPRWKVEVEQDVSKGL